MQATWTPLVKKTLDCFSVLAYCYINTCVGGGPKEGLEMAESKLDSKTIAQQQWIAGHLKEVRETLGLTLGEVATKMGVARGRVSDAENGYYDIKLTSLLRHLSALGVNLSQFTKNMPDNPKLNRQKLEEYRARIKVRAESVKRSQAKRKS